MLRPSPEAFENVPPEGSLEGAVRVWRRVRASGICLSARRAGGRTGGQRCVVLEIFASPLEEYRRAGEGYGTVPLAD
jgi:hypothetical protein